MVTYAILMDAPGVNAVMIQDTAQTAALAEARIVELEAKFLDSTFSAALMDVCETCGREPVDDGGEFCSESCYLGWLRDNPQTWPSAVTA